MAIASALALLAAVALVAPSRTVAAQSPPAIGHVFVIVLENESYATTFGTHSRAPFLARTLPTRGVLLTQYYGTGHYSLDNYLAMISGQAANPATRDDCETFSEFLTAGTTPDGQAIGSGCVYPRQVRTIADELTAVGRSWRGYFEGMGDDPRREAATCGHPALGAVDNTQKAEPPSDMAPDGDGYATRHDPFVYFHSIIDKPVCAERVVNLRALAADLATVASTPSLSFIVPDLCHDGHDMPCKNREERGGLESADGFLREWVPKILESPAYRQDGLLVITFDEGESPERIGADGRHHIRYPGVACCDQKAGPNLGAFPQTEADAEYVVTFRSFGGDRTGAVLLSPFLAPGARSATPFNHYSLLRTIETALGVSGHLGYAGQPGLRGFFEQPDAALRLRAPVRASAP